MDASQNAMTTQQFGIPDHKLADWAVRESSFYSTDHMIPLTPENHSAALMQNGHPNKIRNGIANLSAPKGVILSNDIPIYLRKYLIEKKLDHPTEGLLVVNEKQRVNEVITWLVKDWSKEPLLNGEVEMNQRIAEQQYIALRRLENGEKQADVLKTFLQRSGLYYTFERSLGL